MKELEIKQNHKIEIKVDQEQKKEIKLIGQQRKVKGLTLWEYNEKTKQLKKAEFKKTDLSIKSIGQSLENITQSHKVIVNEDCFYFQALNLKNAQKHVAKKL